MKSIKPKSAKELNSMKLLNVRSFRFVPTINTAILYFVHSCNKFLNSLQQNSLGKLVTQKYQKLHKEFSYVARSERGDVPGWVLVVLMTTGLVTGIWTVAQPRLSSILKNSLDNMNSIR